MNNDLVGHSGCKIYLLSKNKLIKKSPNIKYNNRLNQQITKQSDFKSNLIKTPKIISTYKSENLFVAEMEYVNSLKLSTYIEKKSIDNVFEIFSTLNSFIENNLSESTKMVDNIKIENKLNSLNQNKIIKSTNICDKIKTQLDDLNIPFGYCHGDLTLENILIKNEKVYFIDFLDSFIESPLIDYAKLYQDIYFKWSFRNSNKSSLINIKLQQINKIIFNGKFIRKYNKSIDFIYAINLLRIVPYTNSQQMILKILIETYKIIDKWK